MKELFIRNILRAGEGYADNVPGKEIKQELSSAWKPHPDSTIIQIQAQPVVIEKLSTMRLSSHFEIFLNVLYYLFFIPFKITRAHDKSYRISTNFAHRIICGIVHPALCLNSILEIRGSITGKVRMHPELFFVVGERITSSFYIYIFTYTVWCRQQTILSIFESCEHNASDVKSQKVRRLIGVAWILLACCSVFAFTCKFLSEDLSNPDLSESFQRFIQRFRYEIYLISRSTLEDSKTPNCDVSFIVKFLASILLVLRAYKFVLIDCIGALCLISSIGCFKMARKFKHCLEELDEESSSKLDEHVLHLYGTVKENFKKINTILGPFYVVCFVSLITFFAGGTVDILDSGSWSLQIRMGIYDVEYFFLFLLAAEAHYQASYFKTWLLTRQMNNVRDIGNYLEVENRNIGITGGRLFTVTYGFLGTAGSIILTYAIITLQFGGARSAYSH